MATRPLGKSQICVNCIVTGISQAWLNSCSMVKLTVKLTLPYQWRLRIRLEARHLFTQRVVLVTIIMSHYRQYSVFSRLKRSVSSVQFSCSVMFNSLRPHGLRHTRPSCPSPTPGAYSNSCPSSLVMPSNHLILCCPLSSHLQFFPASGSFPMSQFFASSGQSIGGSASVLPMNIQD